MFEIGPNGFPMPKNLGIDTKIKSLACSERKSQIRPDMCTVLPRIVYRETLIETKRISKTHFSTLMTCHYS